MGFRLLLIPKGREYPWRWAPFLHKGPLLMGCSPDGTISPPFEQDSPTLPMFSSDICRSVYGAYQKDVTAKQSISLRRYVGTAEELANYTANPDNIGFCTPGNNSCLPSGLLNISNCQIVDYFHIPVVVSFPHFYMADPSIISSVGGMHPVPEEHQTAVDVEPWTGQVLQAFKRLQINMYLTKVEDVSITGNIHSVFLPVFWLNESAVVDEKHAKMLHNQLFVPMEIVSVVEKVLMAVGALLVLLAIVATIRKCVKGREVQRPGSAPPLRSTDRVRERRPQGRPLNGGSVQMERGEEEPLLQDGGGAYGTAAGPADHSAP
ncbi:lysosome membrane protein 2-like [Babylonia areolata]|uniref:lysosome membrane protein 2-like n=1 Tax=Babylonia areolata TaxID=304850 RepID=UPI003FD20B0E